MQSNRWTERNKSPDQKPKHDLRLLEVFVRALKALRDLVTVNDPTVPSAHVLVRRGRKNEKHLHGVDVVLHAITDEPARRRGAAQFAAEHLLGIWTRGGCSGLVHGCDETSERRGRVRALGEAEPPLRGRALAGEQISKEVDVLGGGGYCVSAI